MAVQVCGNENYISIKVSKENNVVAHGWKMNEVKDIVAIIHKQNDLQNGDAGMFFLNGKLIIKRYEKRLDSVLLTEPEAEPIIVPLRDLIVVGKVIESRISF